MKDIYGGFAADPNDIEGIAPGADIADYEQLRESLLAAYYELLTPK